MKLRDFKREMSANGFRRLLNGKGSHQIWINSAGETFSFPINNTDICRGIVWQFERKFVKKQRISKGGLS